MKIELTTAERLNIQAILPKEENYVALKLIRGLAEKLDFEEDELKKLGVSLDANGQYLNVDPKKAKEVTEIEIKKEEADVIKTGLKKLDEAKKLPIFMMSLYEKFVENKEEKDGKN